MEVIVAEKCGFCPGVRNAISIAEKVLAKKNEVYCLGPIIHNKDVVEQLARKGLKTVQSVDHIRAGATVLIRSHGAAPEQIAQLRHKAVEIVDATCVLVKRVQKIAAHLEQDGYRVVIIGDRDHPEVKAVVGCVDRALVVASQADLTEIDENDRVGVVCQTTQSPQFFREMLCAIAATSFGELRVVNTLCREAIKRQQSAVELCRRVDIMFVLGGLESANTRKLAELCREYNSQTFHLQNWQEFDKKTCLGKGIAGVTAGASTPDWIIDEFVTNLQDS